MIAAAREQFLVDALTEVSSHLCTDFAHFQSARSITLVITISIIIMAFITLIQPIHLENQQSNWPSWQISSNKFSLFFQSTGGCVLMHALGIV